MGFIRKAFTGLLMLMSLNAHSQKISFFQEGAKWIYQHGTYYHPCELPCVTTTTEYLIIADTFLNSYSYKVVRGNDSIISEYQCTFPTIPSRSTQCNQIFFIRHDTLDHKVYYLPSSDSAEILMYDFSLGVGDTIPQHFLPHQGGMPFIIDSVALIQIGGMDVKKFILRTGFYSSHNYIIEGMGSASGLFWHKPPWPSVSSGYSVSELLCFQLDSIALSFLNGGNNTPYPVTDCASVDCTVGMQSELSNPEIAVFPNPVSDNLYFKIPPNSLNEIQRIELYTVNGNLVLLQTNSEEQVRLKVNNLISGVYFYKIVFQKGETVRGKFVKN